MELLQKKNYFNFIQPYLLNMNFSNFVNILINILIKPIETQEKVSTSINKNLSEKPRKKSVVKDIPNSNNMITETEKEYLNQMKLKSLSP